MILAALSGSVRAGDEAGLLKRFGDAKRSGAEDWIDRALAPNDGDPGPIVKALSSGKIGKELEVEIPRILRRMFERLYLGVGEPETGLEFGLHIATRATGEITTFPVVTSVALGSPGSTAGLRPGDVITACEGTKLGGPDPVTELLSTIRKKGEGAVLKFEVMRFELSDPPELSGGGDVETVSIELGPPQVEAVREEAKGRYAGWLHRMHHEHGLPIRFVTSDRADN